MIKKKKMTIFKAYSMYTLDLEHGCLSHTPKILPFNWFVSSLNTHDPQTVDCRKALTVVVQTLTDNKANKLF